MPSAIMSSMGTQVCLNFNAMEATRRTCLSINSLRASSEPSDILTNKLSHSSLVGGAMRERSEINLPIGSRLFSLLVGADLR